MKVLAATLISLLLPALKGARRAARLSVCESNMRQFGIAAAGYGRDFKDRIETREKKHGRGRT